MKSNNKNAPSFFIENVAYQDWFGGQPGVSGSTVTFEIKGTDKIIPDSLYFHKKHTKVDLKKQETGDLWVASYFTESRRDRKMCIETEDEYGNQAPAMQNFPFELKDDEAMLSYYYEKEKFYYKIVNITKKKTLYYP